jgi:hypothetical protein
MQGVKEGANPSDLGKKRAQKPKVFERLKQTT